MDPISTTPHSIHDFLQFHLEHAYYFVLNQRLCHGQEWLLTYRYREDADENLLRVLRFLNTPTNYSSQDIMLSLSPYMTRQYVEAALLLHTYFCFRVFTNFSTYTPIL